MCLYLDLRGVNMDSGEVCGDEVSTGTIGGQGRYRDERNGPSPSSRH